MSTIDSTLWNGMENYSPRSCNWLDTHVPLYRLDGIMGMNPFANSLLHYGPTYSTAPFISKEKKPDEIKRAVVRGGVRGVDKKKRTRRTKAEMQAARDLGALATLGAATTLAYSTNFDWNQCWNNDVVSSFPAGSSDEEGSEQEELQVVELEYACVSNEYSERDEWWLFSPENPDAERWIEASTLERLKIESYGTYRVLNENEKLPPGVKPLPVVLIYCRKRDGRFKCRAVVLGNLQDSALPNYSPVISIPGVRLLITESVASGSGITLFDLTNAFLNAELTSEDGTIAIKLPKSWTKEGPQYAILRKAMYGLKIAPRRWFDKIDSVLTKKLDWCAQGQNGLYTKVLNNGTRIWMTLYVDDVVMGGGTDAERRWETAEIFKYFPGQILEPKIAGDGTKSYDVNGIELEIKGKSYLMHMSAYVTKILSKFQMQDAASCIHPKVNPELIEKQSGTSSFPVREALGALIWLSSTARPDITYDVGLLARYVGKHGATEGTANGVKKIMKYLSGTRRRGLVYNQAREREFTRRYAEIIREQRAGSTYGISEQIAGEFSHKCFVFSDASFATCPITLRSQSGVCVYFRGALVAYKTMRQKLITHSTCESEYCAAADALTFLDSLEDTLHLFDPPEIPGTLQPTIPLFVDNQSATVSYTHLTLPTTPYV